MYSLYSDAKSKEKAKEKMQELAGKDENDVEVQTASNFSKELSQSFEDIQIQGMSEKFVEHQIRYTWRSIYKMHNEQAIKAGGTLAQAVVLLNLNPNKGTPSTSLGPKMGLESTSLGRTLKSMENSGFISRVPNKDDKRGVFIVLTKKGKELRAISKKNGNKFNKVVLNKIGEKNLSIFFDVLKSINGTIKDGQIFK